MVKGLAEGAHQGQSGRAGLAFDCYSHKQIQCVLFSTQKSFKI